VVSNHEHQPALLWTKFREQLTAVADIIMILEGFGRIVIQLSKMSCVRKFFVFRGGTLSMCKAAIRIPTCLCRNIVNQLSRCQASFLTVFLNTPRPTHIVLRVSSGTGSPGPPGSEARGGQKPYSRNKASQHTSRDSVSEVGGALCGASKEAIAIIERGFTNVPPNIA
jgi:hypothetical protein